MKFSLLSVATCLIGAASAIPLSPRASNAIVPGKNYDRIVTIVFENTDYSTAKSDPYLSTLAQKHNGNNKYLITNWPNAGQRPLINVLPLLLNDH